MHIEHPLCQIHQHEIESWLLEMEQVEWEIPSTEYRSLLAFDSRELDEIDTCLAFLRDPGLLN